ncbi:hypothetical protein B1F73_09220 [Pseudomonas syringae]|uniref:hypothetical protein n=1 Tax=Pseudomonas TaxID=286 RepID=UPI000889E46A|nr:MULTISPECIES: hypothetical protein [Pseudomonas]RXU00431.1 hypothetical protein B1F73_09220 [Pseudomonas syringae]RXU26510.1 hypothetical protein B0A92_08120 [Pseudomonas syringae]SDH69249.1 hypothetical protein SAMN05444503_105171 [Pseudomonas sp. BS3767]SDN39622.1 hypothetical protein SAMN05444502_105171 [Pseudomonas sp. BS3759]
MQSHNYVPNVSGWKLDKVTGEFEINSPKISVGSLPEQPQMITVTAGEWAASDLPASAIEHYAFIGAEIFKIPAEYRESAQLTTQDESYDPGFADIRTTLTYQRPETADEAKSRASAARLPEYSIKKQGDTLTFLYDGVPRIVLGNLDKADEKIETPFAVEGDQVSLAQAFIDAGKLSPDWGLRTTTNAAGQMIVAGVGMDLDEDPIEKFVDALGRTGCDAENDKSKLADQFRSAISETELGKALAARIEHEITTRVSADTQLAARIGALEVHAAHANEMLDRLFDCVSQLTAVVTSK